jgi:hypothetical protein
MANVRTLQRSFAGGEVSPEMYGRIDDSKYQAGLSTCRNFIAKATGPAENRPGFAFVRAVKTSAKATRIIPFTYSTTQTMVLEIGAGYFRFHTQGATLLFDPTTAWVTGTAYLVGDLVTSGGVKYQCKTAHTAGVFVTDLAAAKWRVLAWGTGTAYLVGDMVLQGGVYYYCITAHTAGATFGGDAANWYAMPSSTLIYEMPNPYAEADLFDIHYVQSADVLTLVHPNYAPRELRRYAATRWILSTVSFASPIAAPSAGLAVTNAPGTSTDYDYYYVVTSLMADLVSESAASSAVTCKGNLFATGEKNTIVWNAVASAALYNVYKLQAGVYGYIGQTAGTTLVDDNVAPDLSVTPPTYDVVFQATGDYPAAVSYYEQRRVFAGTTNEPQNLWMTKSGTESTMAYSLPIRDDDRVSIRVAAREANTIRHLVPLAQLLILTSAAEWRVTSQNSDAITPTSIAISPQSYVGASNVQPVIVNTNLLYGASRGGHVRECAYNWQANGFITGDLSLRAAHLFDNLTIVDMAFSKSPQSMVWFVSSNGKLLGLTYVPEQQVGAWHQHDTGTSDEFESCAVVAEGTEDVLYVVVKRTINGASVRYIERMASRIFADQEEAYFVDSGLSFDGTNTGATTMTLSAITTWALGQPLTLTASAGTFVTGSPSTDIGDAIIVTVSDVEYTLRITAVASTTSATVITDKAIPVALQGVAKTTWAFARNTFTGLNHLEGATVNILADGAVHPQEVVASGSITLDNPAVIVKVGLPITADIQTLPLIVQAESAFGQGRVMNVNKAALQVYRAGGVFVGPSEDALVEAKIRTTEPYGSPPALTSSVIDVVVKPSWGYYGRVFVRNVDPVPLFISSLVLEVSIGG